jgi:hypothetical protein
MGPQAAPNPGVGFPNHLFFDGATSGPKPPERPTVARFIRDEKRTYPLTWLVAGGLFAASTAWAVYAELVTRVPWEKQQEAFFDMELVQSTQAEKLAQSQWDKEIAPSIKDKIDRKAALEESMKPGGEYAKDKARLDQLNKDFADAETGKTFGGSDLDEAYYYRELAEYARDAAAVKVRLAYRDAMASEDPRKAEALVDAIYADPAEPAKAEGETDKLHHILSEIARNQAHVTQIDQALTSAPAAVHAALVASRAAEANVVAKLGAEVKNQKRVDEAVAARTRIDSPADPPISGKEPRKRS